MIKKSKAGIKSSIKIKINHITDHMMVQKLYEASSAGIKIDLLVRGNCSLVPGVAGVSENISITGIIDRFLEHSRIFIFTAGDEERVFMGSADWMTRNLDNRVEVITPIYDPDVKIVLKRLVEYGLRDNMQGRIVDGKGTNEFPLTEGEQPFRSQEELYKEYYEENEHFTDLTSVPGTNPTD